MLLLGLLAALCFASGGFFMKHAEGMRHVTPTLTFLVLFGVGAILQSHAMRGTGMAVTYVLVLGLEAVLAVGLSVWLLGESMPPAKVAGIAVTLAGIALLRSA
jgi:quaternary ammonium compound-resistance protein SugE